MSKKLFPTQVSSAESKKEFAYLYKTVCFIGNDGWSLRGFFQTTIPCACANEIRTATRNMGARAVT